MYLKVFRVQIVRGRWHYRICSRLLRMHSLRRAQSTGTICIPCEIEYFNGLLTIVIHFPLFLKYSALVIVVLDANGELMKYVIKIDKSKSLHLEFESSEAHHLTENLEAFVDDVVTGRIDRKKLRDIPSTIENLKKDIELNMGIIEERLTKSINHIEDTQKLLHQNQLDLSENLVACMDMVKRIGEASESVAITAHSIMKEVQFLTADTQGESGKSLYISNCS